MQRLIFISGLGADHTAFDQIGHLPYEKVFVQWQVPEKGEIIEHYATRIIQKYEIPVDDILVGLSFGGLLSQKIAEINGNRNIILISSFRDKIDLRWPFRVGLKMQLYKLQPPFRIPLVDETAINFLNSGTRKSKVVLKKMLRKTDYKVSSWSLNQISIAQNTRSTTYEMYLLIGDSDKMVKPWSTKNKWTIKGGAHFMVYDRGEEITKLINHILTIINTVSINKM